MSRLVFSPALFVLVVEGSVWALSAATRWGGWTVIGMFALAAGVLAAILAFPLILVGGGKDRMGWGIVSLCVSAIGIFFGFIFWLEALTVGCGGHCFD